MKDKIVLIDGNSILYRAFYALPSILSANGKYTNALFGFSNMLIKIINDIKPTHIAVAFDVSKHTFRNDIYADYKGTRKPMPDELRSQIEPLKTLLKLMKIQIVEKENVEADDIIGTLSKKFDDLDIVIVTGDRDSLQLIKKNVKVYLTKKGISDIKIMDEAAMKEEYGMTPAEFLHLKALQGDSSDNIPGVRGVGPKTAIELIQRFKSIDNVYNNLDKIKDGVRAKLEASRDLAFMSYDLSRIRCDIPLDFTIGDFTYAFPFPRAVYNFMEENSFASLIKKTNLFDMDGEPLVASDITPIKIDNIQKLQNAVDMIEKEGVFSLVYDENANICFATKDNEWIIPSNPDMFDTDNCFEQFYEKIKGAMQSTKIRKVFFDSKSVRHIFDKRGVEILGKVDDIAIASHLVEGISVKSFSDFLSFYKLSKLSPATGLLQSQSVLMQKLGELSMEELYSDVELPLSQILFDMEKVGFKVDRKRIDELGLRYRKELEEVCDNIYKCAGRTFNVNSAKQLAEVLYDSLGLPHSKKRSTSAEVLEEIAASHEIVPLILRYRKLSKLLSTYIDGLRPHIDSDGKVHTSFKQTLTTTGRLSSVEPNLQNIPIRSEESREVRSIYTASAEDRVLIDADYSQIELRLLAHMSGDEFFIHSFNKNLDIHSQTACQIFGTLKDNVTPDMRRIAKVVNFGIIYGISDYGLASDLKIAPKEARALIDNFYKEHPKVRDYMNSAIVKARESGRVSTILGRTRRMLDINSSNYNIRTQAERAAQNMPLQGSAADIIKLAMIKVYNSLLSHNLDAKLIMQVHDELIIDCKKSEAELAQKIVRECMNTAYELKVPLVCDMTQSYRWSDGH